MNDYMYDLGVQTEMKNSRRKRRRCVGSKRRAVRVVETIKDGGARQCLVSLLGTGLVN